MSLPFTQVLHPVQERPLRNRPEPEGEAEVDAEAELEAESETDENEIPRWLESQRLVEPIIIYIWEKRQKPKPRHNKARKKADGLKKNSQITARGGEQQHVYEPPW